jgi:RPA family protein
VQDPAWRVFAYELNKSTLQVKEDDENGPSYVISPTGAKINRIFVVGVLTEVENVRSSEDLWRARIADPTGTFTVYAGKYQPEAAAFLAQADVPQFVAVLGRARLYARDEASYVSIWSKEINPTTETVRNNWVITTAERTLDRVEALKIALSAELQSNTLRTKLFDNDVNAVLADGITRAVLSYNGSDVIADMIPVIASAIEAVVEPREFTPANVDPQRARATDDAVISEGEQGHEQADEAAMTQEDSAATEALARNKEHVLLKMNELDAGSGVPYDRLIETLEAQGLDEDDVEEAVQELMDTGKCYEPKIGILKLI